MSTRWATSNSAYGSHHSSSYDSGLYSTVPATTHARGSGYPAPDYYSRSTPQTTRAATGVRPPSATTPPCRQDGWLTQVQASEYYRRGIFEGKDVRGKWWPVTIRGRARDPDSWEVEVHDGTQNGKFWPAAHSANLRRAQLPPPEPPAQPLPRAPALQRESPAPPPAAAAPSTRRAPPPAAAEPPAAQSTHKPPPAPPPAAAQAQSAAAPAQSGRRRQRSDSDYARQLAREEYGAPQSGLDAVLSPRWRSSRPSDYLAAGAGATIARDCEPLGCKSPVTSPLGSPPASGLAQSSVGPSHSNSQPEAESKSRPYRSKEREALDNNLRKLGYDEVFVAADGNCQFRSISYQLYGADDQHAAIREQVAKQLRDNPALYQDFVVDSASGGYSKFCTKVATDYEWGDHLTLQAAADALRIRVKVVTSHTYDGNERGRAGAIVRIRPRGADGNPLAEQDVLKEIWLSFYEEQLAEHYNPIVPAKKEREKEKPAAPRSERR